MSSDDVRKGVTQAVFNEQHASIFTTEIAIIAIILGVLTSSWIVFGIMIIGPIFALRTPILAKIMMIVFALAWGAIGFGIGYAIDSTGAMIVLSIFGLLAGFGTHMSAFQHFNDI